MGHIHTKIIADPELYPVDVTGNESRIVRLLDILKVCNITYDNSIKELVRYKLLNECPIALNFMMKKTTITNIIESMYEPYSDYELIRLSEFNNHIRIKYRSCYRIINKTNIDRNELKCLMDKHQLECYNFLKK
jgi:hypothetical protein